MTRVRSATSRWGVRRRSVVIAVVMVFLALLSGGGLLLTVLQSALVSTARQAVSSRAAEICDIAAQDGLARATSAVREGAQPGQLLQIVSDRGVVLAASSTRIGPHPLASLTPAPGETISTKTDIDQGGSTDDFLVAAQGCALGGTPYVMLAAAPIQVQADPVQTVGVFLLGGAPVVLLVVGVAVWVLVGRALDPVEIIREQVSAIDARRLSERVAVPPSRDEIAALAQTMNVMLDRLEAADRSQRSFVSDASHELRSPLSTVITSAEVSVVDPSGKQSGERLETILRESRRMSFLVDNLMTLARADSSGLELRQVDVDLDDVLDGELRHLRAASSHRVTSSVPPVRVVGDPRRLTQVIRNLLENADRHARTTIAVSLVAGPAHALLRVDNDGDPVPVPMRQRIFERFVRLDDTRSRDSGGSGLGLAISTEIAVAHGGTITAMETSAGWCRFEFTLPRPTDEG